MGGDFELRHWRPLSRPNHLLIPDSAHLDPLTSPPPPNGNGYTSLSELIILSPSVHGAVNSPSAVEIRIRNRLVKHAAYAYLQPTPSSTETSRRRRCLPLRRALRLFGSCFGFVGVFLRAIRLRKQS